MSFLLRGLFGGSGGFSLPPLKLDATDIADKLKGIDETNIAELLAFKRYVQGSLENSQLTYFAEPNPPWVPARNLAQAQVFSYFHLKNKVLEDGSIDFPSFRVSEFPGGRSEWLARSMNLGVDLFRRKRTDTTVIVNLIIMDVLHDLPGFQVLDHFTPGNTPIERPPQVITFHPDDPPPPPKRLKIRAYSDLSLNTVIETPDGPTKVVGVIDAAFSKSYFLSPSYKETYSRYFVGTYLAVLNVKYTRSPGLFFLPGRLGMEQEVDQLSAYMAMMQDGQEQYLKSVNRLAGDWTGYGLVTDGDRFRFIFLDQQRMIHSTGILQIKYDLLHILQYFRHIFTAIIDSPPMRLPPDLQAQKDRMDAILAGR